MAKNNLLEVGLYVAGAYVLWVMADQRVFGESLQTVARQMKRGIQGAAGVSPGVTGPSMPSGLPSSTSSGFSGDPLLVRHIQEWQRERAARGENSQDWEAFRAHEQRITGGWDPGVSAPAWFYSGMAP